MSHHLNQQQQEAVRYLDSPLLVLAGAGSGKTGVITHKIAHLIDKCGYAPRKVAAITFTNKAANEMRERVGKLLGAKQARDIIISTFHALGLRILREEAGVLGYKKQFSILDAADTAKIIAELLAAPDKQEIRSAQGVISNWKSAFVAPEAAADTLSGEAAEPLVKLYGRYQETLRAYQAMDFDDLILKPVELFRNHPEVLERWHARIHYMLVDEYQDTSDCQYQLVRLLANKRLGLTVVGDDDQSIYAWRGANSSNIRNLQADYPRLRVIKLEQNYRSSQRILTCANQLIGHNAKLYDKKLWSQHGLGDPVRIFGAKDEAGEAESVVMQIMAHKAEHRTKFSDYAILYRSNYLSRIFEEALREHKIPYTVSGGTSFFERAEIKDIIAYLRLLANDADDPAFIRAITTPRRGIGNQTLEKLAGHAALRNVSLFEAAYEPVLAEKLGAAQYEDLMTFCNFIGRMQERAVKEPGQEVLDAIMRAIDYEGWLFDSMEPRQAESKWKNVADFTAWISRKCEEDGKTLIEMTQTIALMNLLESREEGAMDAVSLSTLHAAKGLEFGHVFLVCAEEGIIPHERSSMPEQIEEERRLMYVGITRARRSLQISYCARRRQGKDWVACEPSRFLQELPQQEIARAGGAKEDGTPEISKEEGLNRFARLKSMLGNKEIDTV